MDVDINTFRERKPVIFTAGGCGRLPFATKTGAKNLRIAEENISDLRGTGKTWQDPCPPCN